MCGIAGIINIVANEPPSLDQVVSMISPLRYRGLDESGVYLDHQAGLGHLRLSIIGIDGGTQPICNETGELWIVYNGEAYNYLELKDDLLARGHRFTTRTDTEVLLHLYEEYGPACLERINGQFAFAIWDSAKRELFLARDRVGVRPLYYAWSPSGQLLFASEIKAILAVAGRRDLPGGKRGPSPGADPATGAHGVPGHRHEAKDHALPAPPTAAGGGGRLGVKRGGKRRRQMSLKEEIRNFVVENFLFGDAEGVTDDSSFIRGGAWTRPGSCSWWHISRSSTRSRCPTKS